MSKQAFWHCKGCGQSNRLELEECPYCHQKKHMNPRRGRALCKHEPEGVIAIENAKLCKCGAIHYADSTSGPEGRWRHLKRRRLNTSAGFAVVGPTNPFIHIDSMGATRASAKAAWMRHTRNKYTWESWKRRGYHIKPVHFEVTA